MYLVMASKIKNKTTRKRSGRVKVTSQGQVSIPRQMLRESGIKPGDLLQATVDPAGGILFKPVDDAIARYAGTIPGFMTQEELSKLRDEWDR